MSFSSALETRVACVNLRLLFEFFRRIKWRLPCLRRKTRPLPVTLNLLATAFLVFAFPPLRAIAGGIYPGRPTLQSFSAKDYRFSPGFFYDFYVSPASGRVLSVQMTFKNFPGDRSTLDKEGQRRHNLLVRVQNRPVGALFR